MRTQVRRAACVAAALMATGIGPVVAPAIARAQEPVLPEPAPTLAVSVVMSGLTNAWDVAFAPDGAMFVTERFGRIQVRRPNGSTSILAADLGDLRVSGETGLMAIEVDPGFGSNRRLYTCQGTTDSLGGAVDGTSVQVVAWTVDAGYTTLTRVNDPLVGGIDGTSGRHGGCQLRIDPSGFLRVGTGDAAVGTNPQNVSSLAGKTLRVDRNTGAGVPGNPFFSGGGDARVFTFGHRNVQGLAVHPTTGEVWSVEHGPGTDDEVNRLIAGGNYGWNPVPGYNETVPMTDVVEFPSARGAPWSSGTPTVAPSGATFLRGTHWGSWQGALAVSTLAGTSLRIMRFDGAGRFVDMAVPAPLNGGFGRLRAAELGPCGVLYLTTDIGGGSSRVLAVSPVVDARGPSATWTGPSQLALGRCGARGDIQIRTFDGAWQPWSSVDGVSLSEPDVASWGSGRLDVYAVGADGALWHRAREGGAWFAWESLGGQLTSAPSAVSWGPNRADVFARGLDGRLWTIRWSGRGWTGWTPVGGVLSSAPEASARRPGVIDVFARGTDGAVYHLVWSGAAALFGWENLGGIASSAPSTVAWGGERTDVFARGTDGALWSTFWDGARWSGWYSLGGQLTSPPDAATSGFGRWDVFARGTDGRFYSRSWTGTAFTGWSVLPE